MEHRSQTFRRHVTLNDIALAQRTDVQPRRSPVYRVLQPIRNRHTHLEKLGQYDDHTSLDDPPSRTLLRCGN